MSPSVNTRENREFASEMKFLARPELAEEIRRWARNCLLPDPHAGGQAGDHYRVTSLYFDTERFDVFHRNGSFGRSKYRVRRYGQSEILFLERKLKTKGLVTKRRSIVPMTELGFLEAPRPQERWAGDWFRRRLGLRQMKPICQISYARTARVGMTPHGAIRLTLDEDLRAGILDRPLFTAKPGLLLSREFVVIEMKFLFALPALFKHVIEEFRLDAQAFSKYRFAVHKLGLVSSPEYEQVEETFEPSSLCLTS